MKKILIIGGTGYIGSALYQFLVRAYPSTSGAVVDTVDLEWFGNVVNPRNIIMDYRHLTKEQLAKYDVVILLAAHSSVPMANNSTQLSTTNNNVINFVQLMGKLKPGQKFIYAGSASVYNGIPDDLVTEDYKLLAPANIYDLTKQDIDYYARMFPEIEYYGLRLATVNGASPNLRSDIMINAMVTNAAENCEIKLFNGNIRRPILSLNRLCHAIRNIIACEKDNRGIYNLASLNSTVEEIATVVANITMVKLTNLGNDIPRTDTKVPIAAYDFSVSSEKFRSTFGLYVNDTLDNVVRDVMHNKSIIMSKRTDGVEYHV